MSRYYLVRHGDAYNDDGVQFEDFPLNNFGRLQALQLAKRLKDNKFDAVYCSRIKRAIETCEIVNDVHGLPVIYESLFNEVGGDRWPQPGFISHSEADINDFALHSEKIYKTFRGLVRRHSNPIDQEIIIFTHGNWIRVLLAKILGHGDPRAFVHFVIHNTSLTIIDVDETGFESIITVSDAAHNHLYESKI